LSGREIEVLGLLVRGRSNREMGKALFLSSKTVGSHVEHIYNKIGVSSRGAAAMCALHYGLVDAIPIEAEQG
jgi:DNA-binding NarL/FixJ family response regulator